MKFKILFPLVSLLAMFMACEEKPIVIPPLEATSRKVLVEELTGVQCTNCPAGTAKLNELGAQYGDNLIVVALHSAAGYDEPYQESKYDFRNPDARAIADYLYVNGDPGAPAASINRRMFSSETETFVYRSSWPGYVSTEISDAPETGLFVVPTYDEETRKLTVKVNITPEQALSSDLFLSVFITEDSIQDVQLKDGTKIKDYMHRHVFRDAITAPTGDPITDALLPGTVVTKEFSTILPAAWNARQCAVVGFIHSKGSVETRKILQADEKRLFE